MRIRSLAWCRGFVCILLLLASACSTVVTRSTSDSSGTPNAATAPVEEASPVQKPVQPKSAAALYNDWANRVTRAQSFSADIDSTASGVVVANFSGRLQTQLSNTFDLKFDGQFQNKPMQLRMSGDGIDLKRSNGAGNNQTPMPREASKALRIGFLRMGMMHNLAGLSGLKGPDHGDGLVDRWVVVENFRDQAIGNANGPNGTRAVSFDMRVSGQISGSSTLWFNAEGIPVQRNVVVHFGDRDMNVIEHYRNMQIAN